MSSGKNTSSILAVDDNQHNLQLLGSVLQKEGYEVAMAMNGEEALAYLREELPDLILLDVMMPTMDGFQVCEEFKKDQMNTNIPVIFLTAKTDTDDVVKGFESGGVDYISKPFKSAELLARVKTHLDLKKAREEILTLKGLLPICAVCKKIRDDDGFWQQVETYIKDRTDTEFTHCLCPNCYKKQIAQIEEYERKKQEQE